MCQAAVDPSVIHSYKSAFIITFAALMALAVAAVAYNSYRRGADLSRDLSTDLIAEMSEGILARTVDIFEGAYEYLETNATLFADRGALGRDQVFRLFWRQLELEPNLFSIYAADPAGNLLQVRESPQLVTRYIDRSQDPPHEQVIYRDRDYQPIARITGGALYEARDQAWYIGAMAAQGNVNWSPVYRFSSTGHWGLTASRAVYDASDRLVAVLAVDVTLEGLSEFLAGERADRNAIAIIVDHEERLVAYPYFIELHAATDETRDRLPSIYDLSDQALVESYKAARSVEVAPGGFAHVTTGSGLSRYRAHLYYFPGHWSGGWKLFFVVPEYEVVRDASRLLSDAMVISAIVLITSVVFVYVLASHLFGPMRRLVKNTELVNQMRLGEIEHVPSRFREIQSMDAAILGMKTSLQTLAKFVPAAVARNLIESGKEAEVGGELTELTFFFSAVAEFGSLCRTLPPERITSLLAAQLDRFTRAILRSQGTIDNYLGEAIMAFWGAPVPVDDGPVRACSIALQCRQIAERASGEGMDNLFAIHRGPAIVGNIGSTLRMSYTAVGDHVELGWKLKALNQRYGTRIIVSHRIQAEASERFWFRKLDVLSLRDAETLTLFELLGDRAIPLAPDRARFVQAYEAGLDAIQGRRWQDAEARFESLAETWPGDHSVQLMLLRSRARNQRVCPLFEGQDTLDAVYTLPSDLASAPPGK